MTLAPTLTADPILPAWPVGRATEPVERELRQRPPLVPAAECRALRDRLAEVSAANTARKAEQLTALADIVERATGAPTVQIGRIAGQFAKPRSCPTEPGPTGAELPVYRGDAVNGLAVSDRTPDPRRMLTAYDRSAEVLGELRGRLYTSHEALLREYEEPLVRLDPVTGEAYGSSAHLLWVGDRTRRTDGAHVDLLRRISNPVAVKLGPTATPDDVLALVERLDPDRQPGRLTLIARLGAGRVRELLPRLASAVRATGARPVWLCDPMHANTFRLPDGRKVRAVDDLIAELTGFVEVLDAIGVPVGGLHLEATPDDVTECLATRTRAAGNPVLGRYRTACDPRLNSVQAAQVVAAFAAAVVAS